MASIYDDVCTAVLYIIILVCHTPRAGIIWQYMIIIACNLQYIYYGNCTMYLTNKFISKQATYLPKKQAREANHYE